MTEGMRCEVRFEFNFPPLPEGVEPEFRQDDMVIPSEGVSHLSLRCDRQEGHKGPHMSGHCYGGRYGQAVYGHLFWVTSPDGEEPADTSLLPTI